MSESNVENFLAEVRRAFECVAHPNHGSDDEPPDGLVNIGVAGSDIFRNQQTPQLLVGVLKTHLPPGTKFWTHARATNKIDVILLKFAHPKLPQPKEPNRVIEEVSLGGLQMGALEKLLQS